MLADQTRSPLRRTPTERERWADNLLTRFDKPMTALGVVFLLLVLADTVSQPKGAVGAAFTVASWLIWLVFVVEFVARMVVAPSTLAFLKKNWWQIIFLVVPFLRFLRAVRALRAARMGRVLSSAVRTSRTAAKRLTSRLGWLLIVTVVVILTSSQLVFEGGYVDSYGEALHLMALATIAGEVTGLEAGFVKVLEVALAVYSVVVFAALAGSIGAYLLEQHERPGPAPGAEPPVR